jgi:hypothetical protein
MSLSIVSRNRNGFLRLFEPPRHFVKVGRKVLRGDPMPRFQDDPQHFAFAAPLSALRAAGEPDPLLNGSSLLRFMIGFCGEKLMPRRKDPTLKDEELSVIKGRRESIKEELDQLRDLLANKCLGANKPVESNSIRAISGGRPESNRRKF